MKDVINNQIAFLKDLAEQIEGNETLKEVTLKSIIRLEQTLELWIKTQHLKR